MNRTRNYFTLLVMFAALLLVPLSNQQVFAAPVLYGADGSANNPSTLYRISTITGAAVAVGPAIGFSGCGAMDFHPVTGILYAICKDVTGANVLITINHNTGIGAVVAVVTGSLPTTGAGGTGTGVNDVSFRNGDNTLFVTAFDPAFPAAASPTALHTINIVTGVSTLKGNTASTGFSGNGLAFSPADTLFHIDQTFNTLNQGTGAVTFIASTSWVPTSGFNQRDNAMDFEPGTGVLFSSTNSSPAGGQGSGGTGPYFLSTVNTATGVVTQIGQTVNKLDAIAFFDSPTQAPLPPDSDRINPFLGDFKCYGVSEQNVFIEDVLLTDQFREHLYDLQNIIKICTMVDKQAGTIPAPYPASPDSSLQTTIDPGIPDQHFVVYRVCEAGSTDTNCIMPQMLGRDITLTDQFGPVETMAEEPVELWVPAGKNHDTNDFPQSFFNDIHYLCYKIGAEVNPAPFDGIIPVLLDDQFYDLMPDNIFETDKLCNPVIKTLPSGNMFGALNVEHLTCYNLLGTPTIDFATFFDQFFLGGIGLQLRTIDQVCLSSDKETPPIGGTLIPVDMVSLAIAGIGVNVLWILPLAAVAAASGIVLYKVNSKKN